MQLVSATQFKTLNRSRNVTRSGVGVRKQMLAPPEQVGGDRRALAFTISTAAVDREQDKIALEGWDLTNFVRNPVVLWGHDAERLPIGRAANVRIDRGALKAVVEFIPEDTPEGGAFAESVYRLARQGFIAATSVGFRPIKWAYTEDKERGADDWFPGIDFEQQELVELSIVTVPANPEALIEEPIGGDGTAIASDTPPVTGEEVTALEQIVLRDGDLQFVRDGKLYSVISTHYAKQEQERNRAARRRALYLALAAGA